LLNFSKQTKLTGVREAVRALNNVDKGIVRELRKDLKGSLVGTAKQIAGQVSKDPPLSGMNRGRFKWTGAQGSVSFTPGKIRRGQDTHPLVSIRLTGVGKSPGFDLGEIAGSRGLRYSKNKKKGRALIRNLNAEAPFGNYKAGRFAYGYFLRQRDQMQKISVSIIDGFAKKFNQKVRRK